ncbi:MAG: hypothetical protein GY784_00840 [Gammaproteobacteria bacterium]|nr:hypothetical protein [Gammaproteobacteria bacterium]
MRSRIDIWFMVSASILFGLFLLNIFLGKAALVFDFEPVLTVDDVGEFLLLLAAVICFMIEVLRQESRKSDVETQSADTTKEDIK